MLKEERRRPGPLALDAAVIIDPNANSPKGVSLSNAVTALFL